MKLSLNQNSNQNNNEFIKNFTKKLENALQSFGNKTSNNIQTFLDKSNNTYIINDIDQVTGKLNIVNLETNEEKEIYCAISTEKENKLKEFRNNRNL